MSSKSFPRIYASYVAHFTEDLAFWISLASISGGPILELGCGPGRVLKVLAESDFGVTGLDHDPEMLDWIRTTFPMALQSQIQLIHEDMLHAHLGQTFPLIIVPCNTFAYFNQSEALQVLTGIRSHMTPDGQAIIVLPNPYPSLPPREEEIHTTASEAEDVTHYLEPISGNPIQVSAIEELDPKNGIKTVTWHFDELHADGRVQRYTRIITYYLRSIEGTQKLIESAGLSIKEIFGNYQYGPITPTSEEIIITIEQHV
jgi:SAM-dependent methyltransferase